MNLEFNYNSQITRNRINKRGVPPKSFNADFSFWVSKFLHVKISVRKNILEAFSMNKISEVSKRFHGGSTKTSPIGSYLPVSQKSANAAFSIRIDRLETILFV